MKKILSLIIAVLFLAAGCGGGGGTTSGSTTPTVSGLALAGAPIIGFVYLKDSAATPATLGPQNIASDGSFTFDVTGLTPPFFMRAEGTVGGQSYDLYSVATGEGRANINPLTNVILADTAGVNDPATAFNDPATYRNSITQAALAQAVTDLQTFLAPLLEQQNASSVNPLTGTFAADHTGIDAILDIVSVEISNTGTITVIDKTTQTTIAETTTSNVAAPTNPVVVDELPPATVVTDIQAIGTALSNLGTALNNPNRSFDTLSPLFATNYGINDGLDRTQEINNWLMDSPSNISSISNLALEFSGSDYIITFTAFFADGTSEVVDEGFIMTNEGGTWKLKGNGYMSDLDSFAVRTLKSTTMHDTVYFESGFQMILDDAGNNGFETAVVTGPGLPAQGITLVKSSNEPLRLIPSAPNSSIYNEFWNMTDSELDQVLDNSVYTIVIKDASNNTIETRQWKVKKRPYKSTELTSGMFPTFSGITSHDIATVTFPGTITFTYAKPTDFTVTWMDVEMSYWGGTWGVDWGSGWTDNELSVNGTSGSIILGNPPFSPVQGGVFQIHASDIYNRETGVWWWYGTVN